MKHSSYVFVALLLVGLFAVASAGCISLGSQTNEILVGNQTVGTVTITPTDELFSPNASPTDRFNVDIDLLSNKSFIDNLSNTEKTELLRLLTGNNSLDISSFLNTTKTDDKTEDFWSSIMDMKLSSDSNHTLEDVFDAPDFDESINDAMDSLNEFLDNIKF